MERKYVKALNFDLDTYQLKSIILEMITIMHIVICENFLESMDFGIDRGPDICLLIELQP